MTLGKRIAERLDLLGMSQAELARRVGMGQSSMNALVNDKALSTRKIVPIAHALRTTPAYLMGESDDPNDAEDVEYLSRDDRELLRLSRELAGKDRDIVLDLMKRLAGERAPPAGATIHDHRQNYKAAG